VLWVHEDPVTKAKRTTDSAGAVTTFTELDPWGGETMRSSSSGLQPHKYTIYERDGNGSDEAMHRRYNCFGGFGWLRQRLISRPASLVPPLIYGENPDE
jgi:hypothetical protein